MVILAVPAWADWDPGNSYKMHYPQLPDPNGWDVAFPFNPLGDDWQCTQTGPVSDVHLWVSFRGGYEPGPDAVVLGGVSIWNNVPEEPGVNEFSQPGLPLWDMEISTATPNVNMRWYGTGDQGWLDPLQGIAARPDHEDFYQINIKGIADPFIQQQDEIYWLVVSLDVNDPTAPSAEIGWKTSISPHFMDDGVWAEPPDVFPPLWAPLEYPAGQSLDLAFVITTVPEPATIAMLVLGCVGVLTISRRIHR